jgi:hypothetical protein
MYDTKKHILLYYERLIMFCCQSATATAIAYITPNGFDPTSKEIRKSKLFYCWQLGKTRNSQKPKNHICSTNAIRSYINNEHVITRCLWIILPVFPSDCNLWFWVDAPDSTLDLDLVTIVVV